MSKEYMNSNPEQELSKDDLIDRILDNSQLLIPDNGVREKIRSAELESRPLRIKMGFDPTSPDLHLGHAVSMQQLRRFQELGHTPVIIIGNFTGRIGDPTGRNKSRPIASGEDLAKNAETYIDQLSKVIDVSKVEIHYNSDWLEKLTLTDLIHVLAQGTLSQTISRDDFRKRLDENSPIALHEIIYPYLQGLDSLAVDADIEVGGVDQLYAFQAARLLQGNKDIDPEALVLMPLLRGLDGNKKMSKSLGNYIGLSDAPEDMFGKVMSIPDELIEEYLRLASSFSVAEIKELVELSKEGSQAMDVKTKLAFDITKTYHGESEANVALEYFNKQFRSKNLEDQVYIDVTASKADKLSDVLISAGIVDSYSKARRLFEQGGVRVEGQKITLEQSRSLTSLDGLKIRVGKKNFIKINQ
jgi:tyrosyl-tRNA synthetase